MPKICYEKKTFRPASLAKIEQANEIISEYQDQGFVLTLRQLYYQFVRRNWIPNSDKEYDKLGALLTDARLAGMVDWDAIEDRTRSLKSITHWDSPNEIVETYAEYFNVSRWENMDYRPEIWIEKEALAGVFARVCEELDVPYFSCRGYGSASEMWRAGCRMKDHIRRGKTPIIFHFGDHDPSGIDMTRDITDRLALFAGRRIRVDRVALNMDQIERFQPPPNPAKVTDSRYEAYTHEYGDFSWELDALEPQVLMDMVSESVLPYRDEYEWNKTGDEQEEGRYNLRLIAEKWDKAIKAVS